MQIVTDKNKVALYYKNEAITYKEFILNTKKIKQFSKIKEFTNNMIYMENRPELLYSFLLSGIVEQLVFVLMLQVQQKN